LVTKASRQHSKALFGLKSRGGGGGGGGARCGGARRNAKHYLSHLWFGESASLGCSDR